MEHETRWRRDCILKMIEDEKIKKICVRMPNWIGDVVMALPALKSISLHFPSAELIVATNLNCSDIFRYIDFYITQLLVLEKHKIFNNSKILRTHSFDAIILFTNSFSSALESKLSNIGHRFGYTKDCRGFLLSEKYHPEEQTKKLHHRFYYSALTKKFFGFDNDSDIPKLRKVSIPPNILEKNGWEQGRPAIGINPGAAYGSAKRWLPERFAETAEHFLNKKYQVIVFSGKGSEADNANRVAQKMKNVINLSGKTTLSELIESISFCDLFLTNDSGPMHIASALGIPLTAIFGPTDAVSTSPSGGIYNIVTTNEPCSPCMKRECPLKHHNCMKNISSTMVIDALEELERNIRK